MRALDFSGSAHCGDCSWMFIQVMLDLGITLPYTVITSIFKNDTSHTVVYGDKTTFDPINNFYISNFRFGFDNYTGQLMKPITDELPIHRKKIVDFYHNYYSLDNITETRTFIITRTK